MECECGGNIEFTVAKDMNSKIILIQAECEACGKRESGWGFAVEDILKEVKDKLKKSVRSRRRKGENA